jgi:hypothetical protein
MSGTAIVRRRKRKAQRPLPNLNNVCNDSTYLEAELRLGVLDYAFAVDRKYRRPSNTG